MKELLQDPTKYRLGENYRGTNIVFPVEFKGEKYIVKKPRVLGSLINVYYVFQDAFFYGTRKISSGKERLKREAKCLENLEGLYSPKLVSYEGDVLVREYLQGKDFRRLTNDSERKKALESGFDSLLEIHSRDVIIGDAHVKNILVGEKTYWIDFDGVFEESDFTKSKAIDILTFVYSTYSATRNHDITTYCAELVSRNLQGVMKDQVKKLSDLNSYRLWFPTRLPMDGKLSGEITKILNDM